MFENYISSNFNSILAGISLDTKYLKKDEILSNDLPEFLIDYLHAEIDYLIYKDKLERTANPNFDFTNEKFKEKLQELDPYYRKNAVFSKYELEDIVKSAVQIRLNFLIRPVHTLVWFVFREELTKSLKDILLRLNYFHDYSYLTDELKNEIQDDNHNKKDILISFAEFKQRLVRIELNNIQQNNIESIVGKLDPMFSFFDLKNKKDENVIPAEALVIYLDDKGFKPLAGYLEKKYINIPDALLSKNEIIKILENLEDSFNNYRDEDILNQNMRSFESPRNEETVQTAEANDEQPLAYEKQPEPVNEIETEASTGQETGQTISEPEATANSDDQKSEGNEVKSRLKAFMEKY